VTSTLPKLIWSNIRKVQYLNSVKDEQLAEDLGITTRTLSNYDRDPSTIKLDIIEKFILKQNISIEELIS